MSEHDTHRPPATDELGDDALWNADAVDRYGGDRAEYQRALLAQYQLYVEMADRISQRRGLANSFFLTLNTALVSVVGLMWDHDPNLDRRWLAFPLAVALLVCAAWISIVRSYRQLNAAKWSVVGELETRLPASPYHRAEWKALGEGKDRSRYWPLSHVERWIPILFATVYVVGFVVAVTV